MSATIQELIRRAKRTALSGGRKRPAPAAMNHGTRVYDVLEWRRVFLEWGPPKPTTRLVGLVISTNMNAKGESSWPSFGTVANMTALGRRTVMGHVRSLVESGWLIRRHRRHPRVRGLTSNSYEASFPSNIPNEMRETKARHDESSFIS